MKFLKKWRSANTKCHISAPRDRIETNPGTGYIRRSSSTSSWHLFMISEKIRYLLRHFLTEVLNFRRIDPPSCMFLFFENLIDPHTKNDLLASIRNQIMQTTAKNKVLVVYFRKNNWGALFEQN